MKVEFAKKNHNIVTITVYIYCVVQIFMNQTLRDLESASIEILNSQNFSKYIFVNLYCECAIISTK